MLLLSGMNLRSGAATEGYIPKNKTKKKHVTNKQMAEGRLETTLKAMLGELKEDITKQISGIRSDFEAFSSEIKQIKTDIKDVRNDLSEAANKIQTAEERVHELEEREVTTNTALKYLLREQKKTNERLDYMEYKSRQYNMRIYQVPEGLEADDPVGFIKSILVEKLDMPLDSLHIMAAHRSLAKRPVEENVTPRSFVVRFMEWNTVQKAIKTAWTKKEIMVGDKRIYFDHDVAQKVQKEKRRYAPIRKQLKEKNIKSFIRHIRHPAKLKVFEEDESSFTIYDTPEDAEEKLRAKGLIVPCLGEQRDHGARRRRVQSTPFQRGREEEESVASILEELGEAPRV